MRIHIISLLSALIFSLLFYNKNIGLNFFLISILAVVLLWTWGEKKTFPWPYALVYLFSALMVFMEPSGFQIFTCIAALLMFIGKYIGPKSSSYLSAFVGLLNLSGASLINRAERRKSEVNKLKGVSPRTAIYLKASGIAALLFLFFGMLYRQANPVFEQLISDIDLSFISVPWVFCTFVGYVLFLHLLRPYEPVILFDQDAAQSNELARPSEVFSESLLNKLRNEHSLGTVVLGALNLLLVFFLITDLIYLLSPDIVSNSDYSDSVHQGVYALMFSIVCAIAIILYFFRGDLNFFKGNLQLKNLAFFWIALNIILVFFTGIKNLNYVTALGFTYKRIGVFVYLTLVLMGLATTYAKVVKKKSFVYLLRTNTNLVFACLILCSALPWDRAITYYNLNNISNPDIHYLTSLRTSNSQLLFEYSRDREAEIPDLLKQSLKDRYVAFRKSQSDRSWQEYTWYQIRNKN
ncbi:MAG: DUF4173 domain-containing protein [Bacteroidota bacterium]